MTIAQIFDTMIPEAPKLTTQKPTANGLKVDDQVIYRKPMAHNRTNLIVLGQIASITANGETATVVFPTTGQKMDIPVSQLESAEKRFHGRARVSASPLQRHII
jgi:hypothetical protein